jgi:hypothetical protein
VVQAAAKVYNVVADVTIATYVPSFVHRGANGSGLTARPPAGSGRRRLLAPGPAQQQRPGRSLLQASSGGIAASLTDLGVALQAALNATGVSTATLSPTDVDYTAAYTSSLLAGMQYLRQATAGLASSTGSVASAVLQSYGNQSLQQDAATDSLLVSQLQSLLAELQLEFGLLANRTTQVELLMNLQAAAYTHVFSSAGAGASQQRARQLPLLAPSHVAHPTCWRRMH